MVYNPRSVPIFRQLTKIEAKKARVRRLSTGSCCGASAERLDIEPSSLVLLQLPFVSGTFFKPHEPLVGFQIYSRYILADIVANLAHPTWNERRSKAQHA